MLVHTENKLRAGVWTDPRWLPGTSAKTFKETVTLGGSMSEFSYSMKQHLESIGFVH